MRYIKIEIEDDEEFNAMVEDKEKMRQKLGVKELTWSFYFLKIFNQKRR